MPGVYGVTHFVRCCHAKGWWHAKGGWMLRKSTNAIPTPPTPTVCAPTVPSLCQACTHPSLHTFHTAYRRAFLTPPVEPRHMPPPYPMPP
eukprot:scaffold75457_cov75-Phaeocystis_antarctica.AAC.5